MIAASRSRSRRQHDISQAGSVLPRLIPLVLLVILLVAMALDTKIVKIGSDAAAGPESFSAEDYGKTEFPKLKAAIVQRAVDAQTLAQAIAADQSAAEKKYGIAGGIGAEMSVKFTGTVGAGDSGIYTVKVPGVPDALSIRMQTGPAINGTDIRDATGSVKFGDFTNQIEYQNAAAALNNEMKKEVLAPIDTAKLSGKTVSVVGVFDLINPNGWLVTPVQLSVQ